MSQDSGFFIALARAGDFAIAPTAAVGLTAPAWVEALQHVSSEAAILLPLVTLAWLVLQLGLKIAELVFRFRRRSDDEDPPDLPPHHS